MTAKELKRIFQKGECLSLDTMRLYNEGKLNKKSMHEVEKHLLECGLCAGAVDGINQKRLSEVNKLTEHIQRRLAVYMNTPPSVSFFRRFGFTIIAALILLAGGCSWWYFSRDKKQTSKNLDSTFIIENKNSTSENSIADNSRQVSYEQKNETATASETPTELNDHKSVVTSSKMENLPAVLPQQQNTLTVGQTASNSNQIPVSNSDNSDLTNGPNTRNANSNAPVRIKSVQVYPPVTLNDKSTRKNSKDGQLGRTGNSEAAFQIDQMPSFPGGDDALANYFTSNFNPISVDRAKLTRYATGIMFVVNAKTGAVSSPQLSVPISPEIDAEILRVIQAMPNWNPGKKRGDVQIMLGITFE